MKITIIGTGYVGLVTGACLAEIGNDVFCLDVDPRKIAILNDGGVPIHEPGLKEIIARNRAAGRLQFSTDVAASVLHGEVQFIAVGTPPDEDGSADLQYVLAAARKIGEHMTGFKVIVDKSTVPVGTANRVAETIREALAARGITDLSLASRQSPASGSDGVAGITGAAGAAGASAVSCGFSVVSNPEFLKEGAAVEDFMRPDRIVLGCDDDAAGERAKELMKHLYAPFNRNHERTRYMDVRSAEFTKYAANAMLATRISFMNEMANLADRVGADIEAVRRGIGSDPRIGYSFLYAGAGYGGSCFPKDVQALIRTASDYGHDLKILTAVEAVNEAQKSVLVDKVTGRFGEDLSGKTFALWGLAFKPNTDDMREAPSRPLVAALLARGATVKAYDPVAQMEAARVFAMDLANDPDAQARLHFVDAQYDATQGADALIIVTEWTAFKSPDFGKLIKQLHARAIFDGRNLYEPTDMAERGFRYEAIGRPFVEQMDAGGSATTAAATSTAAAAADARTNAKTGTGLD